MVASSACASTSPPATAGEGWSPLFDGQTTAGWRGYRQAEMPAAGWEVRDGALVCTASGGDIVTREEFGSFVLSLDWKVSPGGNSGVFFHVTEGHDSSWETGPEYQILDNTVLADGGDPRTSAGANYALHAPAADHTRPAGEWNHAVIEVRGAQVRHWMNDRLIVKYELWSPDWEARVQASKFGQMPDYGRAKRGLIALQDHGDEVAYRHIRILPLD